MPKFTPEDLLQYLYNETDADKTEQIDNAIIDNWTLQEKLKVIGAAKDALDTINFSPSEKSLAVVMQYVTCGNEKSLKV